MTILNDNRQQAIRTFNRVISGFHGWIYAEDFAADNGQVRVYIRQNHDVVFYSNYFGESTLLNNLTPKMQERVITGEEEDQRKFDYDNGIMEDPYRYTNA